MCENEQDFDKMNFADVEDDDDYCPDCGEAWEDCECDDEC